MGSVTLGLYDYKKRFYDPQIGRFTTMDPLAEHFENLTPYQYASNSPVGNIDLDGLEAVSACGVPGAVLTPGQGYLMAKSREGNLQGSDYALASKVDKAYNTGGLVGGAIALAGPAAYLCSGPLLGGAAALVGEVNLASDGAVATYMITKDVIASDALTSATAGVAYSLTNSALDLHEMPKIGIKTADLAKDMTSIVTGVAKNMSENKSNAIVTNSVADVKLDTKAINKCTNDATSTTKANVKPIDTSKIPKLDDAAIKKLLNQ